MMRVEHATSLVAQSGEQLRMAGEEFMTGAVPWHAKSGALDYTPGFPGTTNQPRKRRRPAEPGVVFDP